MLFHSPRSRFKLCSMKWLAAAMLGLAAGLLGLVIGGLATARITLNGRDTYECGSPCFFVTERLDYGCWEA